MLQKSVNDAMTEKTAKASWTDREGNIDMAALEREAQRMRAEAVAEMLGGLWHTLVRLVSKLVHHDHGPRHGAAATH